ncbi:hypothetical protein BDQ17DRAFT_1393890 [Cyathus striatus]|nr:hypothetical protein BDQ17DRAFT_1393890 [Cyathus striatus]
MLPFLQVPPELLQHLFSGTTPQSRRFLHKIRQYNAAFAFTSLGKRGPWVFRIQGQLSHYSSALCPDRNQIPSYAQLYTSNYPDAINAEIQFRVTPGLNKHLYNLPSVNEVAMILPGDGSTTDYRDIIVTKRNPEGKPLRRIHEGHPAYTPLHYVILFPFGENGWHSKIPLRS